MMWLTSAVTLHACMYDPVIYQMRVKSLDMISRHTILKRNIMKIIIFSFKKK